MLAGTPVPLTYVNLKLTPPTPSPCLQISSVPLAADATPAHSAHASAENSSAPTKAPSRFDPPCSFCTSPHSLLLGKEAAEARRAAALVLARWPGTERSASLSFGTA